MEAHIEVTKLVRCHQFKKDIVKDKERIYKAIEKCGLSIISKFDIGKCASKRTYLGIKDKWICFPCGKKSLVAHCHKVISPEYNPSKYLIALSKWNNCINEYLETKI